jgi:Uma2 family endonuclease
VSVTARPARRSSRYIGPMNNVIERKQPATLADLERLPEGTRAELVDGTLYLLPTAGISHQKRSAAMLSDLYHRFKRGIGGPGGWWILATPEIQLSTRRVLIPDLAGWKVDRVTAAPDAFSGARTTLVPDWVAEIRSPSTASHDTLQKGPLYRHAGVQWYWIVDPDIGFVEVYAADGKHWALDRVVQAGETAARLPPFDAVDIDITDWFDPRSGDTEPP